VSLTDLRRQFDEACNYPGRLDSASVENHLVAYLKALGITRKIKRLMPGWSVESGVESQQDAVRSDTQERPVWRQNALTYL